MILRALKLRVRVPRKLGPSCERPFLIPRSHYLRAIVSACDLAAASRQMPPQS